MYAMIVSIGNPVLYQGTDEFSVKNMALFKYVPDGMYMEYVYWFLVLAQDDMKKLPQVGFRRLCPSAICKIILSPFHQSKSKSESVIPLSR